jgi:hypothetical protein
MTGYKKKMSKEKCFCVSFIFKEGDGEVTGFGRKGGHGRGGPHTNPPIKVIYYFSPLFYRTNNHVVM